MLAHELRNPLAPIRHAAALIAAPQASLEQQQRSCQTIERQVERMGALLNDLLDISRITFGRITLHNAFVTWEFSSPTLILSPCFTKVASAA